MRRRSFPLSNPTLPPHPEYELITPAIARELLDSCKIKNRRINPHRVEQYANLIASGEWKITGETIIISIYNDLINGQHRLEAVCKTGVSIITAVARGIDPEVIEIIDSLQPRSMGQVLESLEIPNAPATAAAARVILQWENRWLRDTSKSQALLTRHMQTEFCVKNIDALTVAHADARRIRKCFKTSGTTWAAICFCIREIDAEAAEHFIDRLVDGVGLEAGSPILALRNWAYNSSANKISRRPWEIVGVAAKAWIAYLDGTPLKLVRMYPSEEVPMLRQPF